MLPITRQLCNRICRYLVKHIHTHWVAGARLSFARFPFSVCFPAAGAILLYSAMKSKQLYWPSKTLEGPLNYTSRGKPAQHGAFLFKDQSHGCVPTVNLNLCAHQGLLCLTSSFGLISFAASFRQLLHEILCMKFASQMHFGAGFLFL